jgi:CHASE2 domain-containing sensor protein
MNWGVEDFIAAAVLLLAAVVGVVVVSKTVHNRLWRLVLTGLVILILLATWAQLAVGIL